MTASSDLAVSVTRIILGLLTVLGSLGCDTAEPAEAEQAAVSTPTESKVPVDRPVGSTRAAASTVETLRALAMINEPDVSRARPYMERHALIDQLAATKDAQRIDRRLNLALDLRQAADSPKPCQTFKSALQRIAATADPYFVPHLRAAKPPAACNDLNSRREATLAAIDGDSLQVDDSGSSTTTARGRRRTRSRPAKDVPSTNGTPTADDKSDGGSVASEGTDKPAPERSDTDKPKKDESSKDKPRRLPKLQDDGLKPFGM